MSFPKFPHRPDIDYQAYLAYLASPQWASKRKAVHARAHNICERCEDNPIASVHHLTYQNLGNESLEDLEGLCKKCHEYLSSQTRIDPLKEKMKRYENSLRDIYYTCCSGLFSAEYEAEKSENLEVQYVVCIKNIFCIVEGINHEAEGK